MGLTIYSSVQYYALNKRNLFLSAEKDEMALKGQTGSVARPLAIRQHSGFVFIP